jgi:hypothetical protein
MREIRQSGSEGGEGDKRPSLPLSEGRCRSALHLPPMRDTRTVG